MTEKVKFVSVTRTICPKTGVHFLDAISEDGKHYVAEMVSGVEKWMTFSRVWYEDRQQPRTTKMTERNFEKELQYGCEMKKLKTLEEHNKECFNKRFQKLDNTIFLNGISCPECSNELYDSNSTPGILDKRNVKCANCGYEGVREI